MMAEYISQLSVEQVKIVSIPVPGSGMVTREWVIGHEMIKGGDLMEDSPTTITGSIIAALEKAEASWVINRIMEMKVGSTPIRCEGLNNHLPRSS